MNKNKISNIVNEVYSIISKDYSCNAKVEIHNNIYERLSGIKDMDGSACAKAEYDWNNNKIYLYSSRLIDKKDVIKALIHECVHSTQSKVKFDFYYNSGYSYDNHPLENQARYNEKYWKKYKLNKLNYE